VRHGLQKIAEARRSPRQRVEPKSDRLPALFERMPRPAPVSTGKDSISTALTLQTTPSGRRSAQEKTP